MLTRLLTPLCFVLSSLCALSFNALAKPVPADYQFPLTNAFEATIAGTPSIFRPQLPDDADIKQRDYSLRLRPEREFTLPSNFWPVKTFRYRLAEQSGPAPLIFIIAGTGAHYSSSTMEYLKKLFYGAGFHVAQISSPTAYDFMVGASPYATPGYSPQDARDLYSVMQAIKKQQDNLEVTEWHLTGYSLGGLQAAFVSHLDEQEQAFNFKRVLLINPPVNLYASIKNLSSLVNTQAVDSNDHRTFYELLMDKLTRYFNQKGHFDFNEAVLFDFQNSKQKLSDNQLAMLIGSAFRFASADINFTSDLINRRGIITPAQQKINDGTSLTPFFKRALLCDFDCYIEQQLLPFWKVHFKEQKLALESPTTEDFESLSQASSLYALADYLSTTSKIGVMHNADDIILGTGDLGFLKENFAERLTLYPYGGHLGNLDYRDNGADILEFFHE
ncbi:alpha/beta fold hydrolase [Denitrificimonas caeni]|uniref:alpha/beta fold hydrolase n=1 Tax=Denitrificimonas caeni TaxID=521720 RepID=UPI0003B5B050|nr:serine protein kinase PrkA [Denitrificimonas caeni]